MSKPSYASWLAATVVALVPFAAQAQGQGPELPAGAGKDTVQAVCTGCHQTNMITLSSGYTRDDWKALTSTMIEKKALLPDSGGPGRERGGAGQEMVIKNDSTHPMTVACLGARTEFPPLGLRDGGPGPEHGRGDGLRP